MAQVDAPQLPLSIAPPREAKTPARARRARGGSRQLGSASRAIARSAGRWLWLSLALTIALPLLSGCGAVDPGSADAGNDQLQLFIASVDSLTGFMSWKSFAFDSPATPDMITHTAGHRIVYINHLPPKGSTAFPVGTIIVKQIQPGTATAKTFAMSKRGGTYNSSGAAGWEWIELDPTAPDTAPGIIWRGVTPPAGENYSGSQSGTCNDCHGADSRQRLGPGHGPRAGKPVTSSRVIAIALAGAALLPSGASRANPRALPFTYPSESLPKGASEVEQYTDLTPVKAYTGGSTPSWTLNYTLTTEFEHGITNRLELGLYLALQSDTGSGSGSANSPLTFSGIKQRLRYRFAAPGQWPVDVAVYLELAELSNEVELEGKLNLQRRVGPVRFMVNLWAEHEFYYNGMQEWVLNPTAGVTAQIRPMFHLGFEYWMHAEVGRTGGPALAPSAMLDAATVANTNAHSYLGPAMLLQFGRFWWSTGAYLRLDGIHDPLPVGALYGHFWIRTIIGLDI